MGRQIEVTQFSAVEFEAWSKASPRPEMKPIRTKAFEEFERQKLFNDKVVRVRVLRDSEDTEMKVLTFTIEKKLGPPTRTEPKSVEQKPRPSPKALKPQSLLIPNIRLRVLTEFVKIAGFLVDLPDIRKQVEDVAMLATDVDITDIAATAPIRHAVLKLLQDIDWKDGKEGDPDTTAKILAWSGLDLINGILAVSTRMDPPMDKDELKMLYNRIFKPAPQHKPTPLPKRGPANLPPLNSLPQQS